MQATCTVHPYPYPARWRVSFTPRREETSSKLDRQLNICSKHVRLSRTVPQLHAPRPHSQPAEPPSRRAVHPDGVRGDDGFT